MTLELGEVVAPVGKMWYCISNGFTYNYGVTGIHVPCTYVMLCAPSLSLSSSVCMINNDYTVEAPAEITMAANARLYLTLSERWRGELVAQIV